MDPSTFVRAVQPLLESKDLQGLHSLLKSRYTPEELTSLLSCECDDARKVAALSLSLVGGRCCIEAVARQLRHPDPVVNEMAEHALWLIWFRCGTPEANHQLCRGTKALNRRDFEHAITHFDKAIELQPEFAEAYNQRATASYLQERFDEAIVDYRRAIAQMPCHFNAWAGLGHCFAHEGRMAEAVESYKTALKINPHLETIRQVVAELTEQLGV